MLMLELSERQRTTLSVGQLHEIVIGGQMGAKQSYSF
jgi:hypothetical protein